MCLCTGVCNVIYACLCLCMCTVQLPVTQECRTNFKYNLTMMTIFKDMAPYLQVQCGVAAVAATVLLRLILCVCAHVRVCMCACMHACD